MVGSFCAFFTAFDVMAKCDGRFLILLFHISRVKHVIYGKYCANSLYVRVHHTSHTNILATVVKEGKQLNKVEFPIILINNVLIVWENNFLPFSLSKSFYLGMAC